MPTALGVPEQAESDITLIRRASTESAARHADDIRDMVQSEREEMTRQLQLEREVARIAREALEQQVLAERARVDEERHARARGVEDEVSRVCTRNNSAITTRSYDARRMPKGTPIATMG